MFDEVGNVDYVVVGELYAALWWRQLYLRPGQMRRNVVVVVLITTVAGLFGARCKGAEKPSARLFPVASIEKLNSTPDMTQTDPDAGLPNGGRSYCGPVAVSNSLMWFADNGFGNLAPSLRSRRKAQHEVARMLGSEKYMNTDLKTGTGVGGVLEGLARYVEDKGYEYRYLKFQGWRKHPGRFGLGVDVPRLSWIKSGIKGNSAVWLNVGWYKYNSSSDEYARTGGHWVTLVGYGVDEKGKQDPAILIIHDPAPRCGKNPHEYVRMEVIDAGRLTGKRSGLPRRARGFYAMAGGMHVKKTADLGILDGVVVLKMDEKTTQGQK